CAPQSAPPAARVKHAIAADHQPVPRAPDTQRLPRAFVPVGYKARLAIGDGLTGHIEIVGDVAQPTSLIWLHGDPHLDVHHARATRDGTTVEIETSYQLSRTGGRELVALQPKQPLAPGRWMLSLDYAAPIVDVRARVQALDHAYG